MAVPLIGVDLWWLRFALPRAHVAAHGATVHRELIVVRVRDAAGGVGWGECDALEEPGYSTEYTAGAWEVLRTSGVPTLLAGGGPAVTDHPMASAALAGALLDAELRTVGTALRVALGGVATRVASTAVCGLAATPDDLLAMVEARVAAGHRSVKLKVQPGWDREPVAAVRAAWPELALAVDANGSYPTADLALAALGPVASAGVDYIEQPLPPADLVGSAALAARLEVPVALDEAVCSMGDLRRAVSLGAGSVLNVKSARLGGPRAAVAVADAAAAAGVACFGGGMLEAGVGRAIGLAVAAIPACGLPTDLGPTSRYLSRDIVAPIELDADGCLAVPDGPGIGVEPDLARLGELAVTTWSMER